ncbi:uncharacterized protein HHUB_3509 [Halobacterium hubeiense]|uniref:Uncharacterized protein n=1 Tax=Halobacterium hubeiense TaxID=1407499 RepID=A0A0U5D0S2_9EURY|nr:uncharacterized protein HHUB_3509 [Halobacterium hubeiense]
MRFDYALRENADELFENLESASESQPNDFTRPTVRDNLLRDYTFSFDGHRISPHFESVQIRAVEANYGFVEVVSVAEVEPLSLLYLGIGSDVGDRHQRKVYWLTLAVTVLTVVLTIDALLIRGLGQFIYNLTMNRVGASPQVWNSLMGILALLVILLSPAIGTSK